MSDMRFDWYASLDESWLNDLVRLVQETIDQDRSTRGLTPGQKQDRALQEALISQKVLSALYQAYCFTFPRKSTRISFPLDKSCFTTKGNHPEKIAFSATYTRNVFEALLILGWITVQKGSEYGG